MAVAANSATVESERHAVALATPQPTPRGRTRLPHIHPAWIVVFCSCALLFRASMHVGLNTDVFWQLAAGRWMVTHHALIRQDTFTYTVHGRPWLAEEWGFEVLLAELVRHLGPVSYWLVSGGCCAGALGVSAVRWCRLGASAGWVAVLSLPTTAALLIGLAPRPQALSYLFFALALLLLTEARRRRAALVWFPLLVALWANVHGSFLLGLGLVVLEVVLAFAATQSRRSPLQKGGGRTADPAAPLALRDAVVTLFSSTVASLFNPHGIHLLVYAARVTTSAPLAAIEEWQSPNFHTAVILLGVAVPTILLVIGAATGRRGTHIFDLVLWSGCLLATLHAVRFAPYLGIAAAGLAAPWNIWRGGGLTRTRATAPLVLALVALLLAGPHVPAGRPQPSAAPVAAVSWLTGRSGRVFSTYEWNDYLMSRNVPVFVDGRTDLYFGTSILATYEAVTALHERPDPILDRWRVRWVLWPAHQPLSIYLASDPSWHVAHRFGSATIFERD